MYSFSLFPLLFQLSLSLSPSLSLSLSLSLPLSLSLSLSFSLSLSLSLSRSRSCSRSCYCSRSRSRSCSCYRSRSRSCSCSLSLTLPFSLSLSLGHKNTSVPHFESPGNHFFWSGALRSGQFRGQKGLGPLEKQREMPHYMFCPRKKNNIPDFQNQRYINSYKLFNIYRYILSGIGWIPRRIHIHIQICLYTGIEIFMRFVGEEDKYKYKSIPSSQV